MIVVLWASLYICLSVIVARFLVEQIKPSPDDKPAVAFWCLLLWPVAAVTLAAMGLWAVISSVFSGVQQPQQYTFRSGFQDS